MKRLQSSVTPNGEFVYGIHKPAYTVTNLRQQTNIALLGCEEAGQPVDNTRNYPQGQVKVDNADWIYEIPNPFPFRGRTFIDKEWADNSARNPARIRLPEQQPTSLSNALQKHKVESNLFADLPEAVQLALATCSTDPADLIQLAKISCEIIFTGEQPSGLQYRKDARGNLRPVIHNHELFEAVANNPTLPDEFKIVMVIRPGAQGGSEIVGEWPYAPASHVYEYLRRNSYIAGGHYAANMSEDAIRYTITQLNDKDIRGLRHLYYQRTFVRLAEKLGVSLPGTSRVLSAEELEELRLAVLINASHESIAGEATLWGWNFGFDYAPSKYRLHASHQQIHQQYAMIPDTVEGFMGGCDLSSTVLPAYGCGDLVADWIEEYRNTFTSDFFADYRRAICTNKRMDERDDLSASLILWQDEQVMLFVPKAQTSQWELQLMTLPDKTGESPGNIVECDSVTRQSLDTGILKAQQALEGLGAQMVTSIELPKRLGIPRNGQPLLYSFLPRLPESPGAFSEAQLRFINGHYPEDFAAACRRQLSK